MGSWRRQSGLKHCLDRVDQTLGLGRSDREQRRLRDQIVIAGEDLCAVVGEFDLATAQLNGLGVPGGAEKTVWESVLKNFQSSREQTFEVCGPWSGSADWRSFLHFSAELLWFQASRAAFLNPCGF